MTERKAVYQTKNEIKIGAKDLASLAMPDACPRCFWIKQKAKPLPFQIFPGIFSSIDAYTKKIVHSHFDEFNCAPEWLPALKNATGYLNTPYWTKFRRLDIDTNILVQGMMDGLFGTAKGPLIIVDYKTAKYTQKQDELLPLYKAQLNLYKYIQDSLSLAPVKELHLIYLEPVTVKGEYHTENWLLEKYSSVGFNLEFSAYTVNVTIDEGMVHGLLATAKGILEEPEPPAGTEGCADCAKVNNLVNMCG